MSGADPYALPVLTATVGALCKRWQRAPDGSVIGTPYGQAYFHTLYMLPPDRTTDPLASLAANLRQIARARASCVIRGEPKPALADVVARNPAHPVRRTLDNFADTPRAWALIDIDTPPPANAPPPALDPEGYAQAVRANLPAGMLQATACAFVLSSSCGIKAHKAGVHFWFLLDEPLPSAVLRAWAPTVGADPALFHPVQVHYTAPPQFYGMADPLPRRIGVLPGAAPALPAVPIRAIGARIRAQQKLEAEIDASKAQVARDAPSTGREGDREHATALQVAEAFGIVTAEDETGATLCDCPRHNSDSRRSLHIDPDGDRWYCFGCQKGGGAWALAAWCLGDDAATEPAIIQALRAARMGEKVATP